MFSYQAGSADSIGVIVGAGFGFTGVVVGDALTGGVVAGVEVLDGVVEASVDDVAAPAVESAGAVVGVVVVGVVGAGVVDVGVLLGGVVAPVLGVVDVVEAGAVAPVIAGLVPSFFSFSLIFPQIS